VRLAVIVVFGSVNVDFVTRVARIPNPGETVLGPDYAVIPGGKGANQALAAARAGGRVTLVAAVGQDPFAEIGLSLLREAGVDLTRVARAQAHTGAAFIAVDDKGENAITVAAGANAAVAASQLDGLDLGAGDTVLFQREVPQAEVLAAARRARAAGARLILNTAPAGAVPRELIDCLDVLVANEHEATIVAEGLGLAPAGPEDAARLLDAGAGLATVVTLGADGAVAWAAGERVAAAALPVVPVDTTAAGDAFCGAFAAALDRGADLAAAMRQGAVAGSIACTRPGAQPSLPMLAEIEAALAR
jgi:ribokinase